MLPHGFHDVEVFGHDFAVGSREVVHELEIEDPGLIGKRCIAVDGACENLYWTVTCRICGTCSYAY